MNMRQQKTKRLTHEEAEKYRIAQDLGIDINNLSLKPTKADMAFVDTPTRKNMRSTILQAIAFGDQESSDSDSESSDSPTNLKTFVE